MNGIMLARDLARIIDDAAIFAGKDSTLPMLNAIRFESTAKHLIAVATDRFCLGSAVADYLNPDEEPIAAPTFNAMLKLSQAQALSKVAKSTRAAFTDVAITVTGAELVCAFTSGEKLHLPLLSGMEFPDWRRLVHRPEEDATTKVFGVNPQYLARFGRVHDAHRMTMKFSGPGRPALITVGGQFVGCIMPVRLDTSEGVAPPDWMAKPEPAPEPAKKPARKSPKKAVA